MGGSMKRNLMGSTGLAVTEVAFGGASIGNLYVAGSDDDAAAAVAAAWDGGIRYFDTAPHYGLGLSERRLGETLSHYPRDEFVLSTKVGRLLVPNDVGSGDVADDMATGFAVPATSRRVWDFSRDGVRRSIDESLTRLGLDHVDIAFLHDPDDHWQQAVSTGFAALAELRDEGMVRAIGAGMNQWQMLEAFVRETDMDVVMLAGRYTLLDQSALETLLPLCVERGVSVVNVAVFNSGLLSKPDPERGMRYNYGDAPTDLVDRAIAMAAICRRHGVTLPVCAFQFGSAHPAVVSTGMGASTAQRVRANLEMFNTPVPADVWAELVSEGFLRPDAPTPSR
jgi:D-threo-aldose 1-dehydrogenase